MRIVTAFACAATVVGLITGAAATTWYVPSPECPTIQAGIDSAATGDTVLVADGTYSGAGNRNIDFLGKAILVTSENGPEVTIIDVEGGGNRGFWFHNGEGSSSIVRGFTIQGGMTEGGAGISCEDSSPRIEGNIICAGEASSGGGINCYQSAATIVGNTITGNWGDDGGGICCYEASPLISGNVITENRAFNRGGGIYSLESSPVIEGNTIESNLAMTMSFDGYGGGIYCRYGSPAIVGNTITENVADYLGGGIYWALAEGIIEHSTITLNTAASPSDESYGGGIYEEESPLLVIRHNTITGNVADRCGSGIASYSSSSTIEYNLIGENDQTDFGGGVYCEFSNPTIRGNTIGGNYGYYGGGIYCGASLPVIDGNLITENESGYGGGVYCDFGSDPSISGNTLTGNSATQDGGGICCWWSTPTVVNCILWQDDSGGGHGEEVYLDGGSVIAIDYSDVEGGSPGIYVAPDCTLHWGAGNMNANPLFVSGPLGDYYLSQIAAGQGSDSPCVDAGDPSSAVPADGTTRTDRVADAWPVDMGYHYPTNCAPDLEDQPDTTVGEEHYLTVTLQATDPEEDSIAFSSPDLPSGATLDAVTGVFEWTPTYQQAGVYTVTFIATDDGSPALADTQQTDITVTDVVGVEDGDEEGLRPMAQYLAQNYPNPFGSRTTIAYSLRVPGHVCVSIYDIRGALVREVVKETAAAGLHRVVWDGRDARGRKVGSGIYFCRLEAADFTETRRMVILR